MFKKNLHSQPAGVQLAVFLFIWAAFFLIFSLLRPFFVTLFLGTSQLPADWPDRLLQHPESVIFLNAFSALIIFLIPSFLFTLMVSNRPFAYVGLRKPLRPGQWIAAFILACGLIPILTGIGGWLKELNLGAAAKQLEADREAVFNAYFKAGGVLDLLRNLFFLALIPAFCEEVFFRGIVQKFAYSWFHRQWAAIVFSGMFFALLHFTVYEFVPILLAGMVLAWVYYITRSLWLSVLVHFLNNGIQVLLVFFAARYPTLETIGVDKTWVLVIFAGGVALFFGGVKQFQHLKTPLPNDWSMTSSLKMDG